MAISPEMYQALRERQKAADEKEDRRTAMVCGILAGRPYTEFMPKYMEQEDGDPAELMAAKVRQAHYAMMAMRE
jgi:hypothetical protein